MKGESKFGNPNVTYELNIVDLQSFDLFINTITLSELDKWMENLARPLTFSVKNQIDEWIHLKINIDILIDCISFYVLFENTGILLIWRRHQSHGWVGMEDISSYSHWAGRDLHTCFITRPRITGLIHEIDSHGRPGVLRACSYPVPRSIDRSTDRRTDGRTDGRIDR